MTKHRFMFFLYVTGRTEQTVDEAGNIQSRGVSFYTRLPMDLPYIDDGCFALAEDITEKAAIDVHHLADVHATVTGVCPMFIPKVEEPKIIIPTTKLM